MLANALVPADFLRAVNAVKDDMFAFASRLVRTPSLPGEEAAVQALVKDKLDALGLETATVSTTRAEVETHPASCDDGIPVERRVNVVGRWKGTGEGGSGRSIILNGHVDVVPPGDETLWTDSPWSGRIRDGRLQTIRTRGGSQRVLIESMSNFLAGTAARYALDGRDAPGACENADVNGAWSTARTFTSMTGGPDAGHEERSNAATDYLGKVEGRNGRIAVSPGEGGGYTAQANTGE